MEFGSLSSAEKSNLVNSTKRLAPYRRICMLEAIWTENLTSPTSTAMASILQ